MHGFARQCLRLCLLVALSAGCGGTDPPPPPRKADRISLSLGGGQTAQAGSPLVQPLQFITADAQGPIGGATVSFSLLDQTGFLSAASAVSSATGLAEVRWTVGGQLGSQTLTATLVGAPPINATATVTAGPASLMAPVSEANQFAVVGSTVASAPTVMVSDAFGNPIPDVAVSFTDNSGRSTIVGTPATTGPAGRAGLTSWTIGHDAGSYSLVAVAGNGLTTIFAALGTPLAVQLVGGAAQSANVGTAIPINPSIRALGNGGQPLSGVAVSFAVTAGGGRLLGAATVTTGSDGLATAPRWILGPNPGANSITATAQGLAPISISATGLAATPAALAAVSPLSVVGLEGNFGPKQPTVRVVDALGNPVAGAPVTFAVVQGAGTISAVQPVTDFDGQAALGYWRFGNGTQRVTATAGSLPTISFTATTQPPPPSGYTITIRFLGTPPTASQQAAFDEAAARWATLVLGDLSDQVFTPADDIRFCGGQLLDETVDDLLIFAEIKTIDGAGGILGQAGPCIIRDDNLLSVLGVMQFDSADVANLESSGRFKDVVLHEMGHIVGVGTFWDLKGLLTGGGTSNPFFTGVAGQMAFRASATSSTFSGSVVPVENSGGPGTRDSHWRESILKNELMTGFLNSGSNPLSAITAASIGDLGYLVNDAAADPFTLRDALRAATTAPFTRHTQPWPEPIRTRDRSGRLRRIPLLSRGPLNR